MFYDGRWNLLSKKKDFSSLVVDITGIPTLNIDGVPEPLSSHATHVLGLKSTHNTARTEDLAWEKKRKEKKRKIKVLLNVRVGE